jgi:hypothetical protein
LNEKIADEEDGVDDNKKHTHAWIYRACWERGAVIGQTNGDKNGDYAER